MNLIKSYFLLFRYLKHRNIEISEKLFYFEYIFYFLRNTRKQLYFVLAIICNIYVINSIVNFMV
jgi:hypothetical protein